MSCRQRRQLSLVYETATQEEEEEDEEGRRGCGGGAAAAIGVQDALYPFTSSTLFHLNAIILLPDFE